MLFVAQLNAVAPSALKESSGQFATHATRHEGGVPTNAATVPEERVGVVGKKPVVFSVVCCFVDHARDSTRASGSTCYENQLLDQTVLAT
jgi:hypothetical protein